MEHLMKIRMFDATPMQTIQTFHQTLLLMFDEMFDEKISQTVFDSKYLMKKYSKPFKHLTFAFFSKKNV